VLRHASVPILRFVDIVSGLPIDVSINNAGRANADRTRIELQRRPAMRPVLLALKVLLRQLRLHETYSGGIGSHLLFAMVLKACSEGPLEPHPGADLGALLLRVLRQYAFTFGPFSLLDPFEARTTSTDIGAKAFKFHEASHCFRRALRRLEAAPEPCLSCLLDGWEAGSRGEPRDLAMVLNPSNAARPTDKLRLASGRARNNRLGHTRRKRRVPMVDAIAEAESMQEQGLPASKRRKGSAHSHAPLRGLWKGKPHDTKATQPIRKVRRPKRGRKR